MDLPIHLHIMFRALKHMTISIQLLRIQASKVLPTAVTDEERAEDNILDLVIFSVDCPAGPHAVELALVIADDADFFFKRIIGLDESSSDRPLEIRKLCSDLCDPSFTARLAVDNLDCLRALVFHRFTHKYDAFPADVTQRYFLRNVSYSM